MSNENVIGKRRSELLEIYTKYHPPLETRFEEEVQTYWGRNWGVSTEVGKLRAVLLHRPGEEILSIKEPLEKWRSTEKPDLKEMLKDYEKLLKAFREEGVEVIERKAETNHPPRLVKSIYTRDPSFTVKGGVIIGRMYDALRRGEELPTTKTYAELGCPILLTVHGTGTIEGGSVIWLDSKHIAIGLSYRVNEEGAKQVKQTLHAIDPSIEVLIFPEKSPGGHLDVPVNMVNVKTVVVDKSVLPVSFVNSLKQELKMEVVERPPNTYVEGTVVLEPGKVLFDYGKEDEKKRGKHFLEDLGLDVHPLEISSLTVPRNSGTLHCLTMPLIRDPEPE
jgi:N-dimethylarginine dimethylaminohydrolase